MDEMKKFLAETVEFTHDDGCINAASNQEILSDVWQGVFHLLDAIPREVCGDFDAGAIASLAQRDLEFYMFRLYLGRRS